MQIQSDRAEVIIRKYRRLFWQDTLINVLGGAAGAVLLWGTLAPLGLAEGRPLFAAFISVIVLCVARMCYMAIKLGVRRRNELR